MAGDSLASRGGRRDDPDDRPASLVRPFLGRRPAELEPPVPLAAFDRHDDVGVRPYFLTGGRTRSANERISYETIVVRGLVPPSAGNVDRERLAIYDLCGTPQSMAELSARLRLPIGVICVLSGDLANLGVLAVHEAPTDAADDIELLNLLIDVLRQL